MTTATAASDRALLLFAPKFREFGIGVAKGLVQEGFAGKIVGVCTGGAATAGLIRAGLDEIGEDIVDIEAEERKWTDAQVTQRELKAVDANYPLGTVGRIITSDRRVGSGFVTGALTRPSLLKHHAQISPTAFPTVYVACAIRFFEAYFERVKPKAVFMYAHAGAVSAALVAVAERVGTPVYRLVPARIGRRFLVDAGSRATFEVLKEYMSRTEAISDSHRRAANTDLRSFRKQPEPPEYVTLATRHWPALATARQIMRATLATAKYLLPWLLHEDKGHLIKVRRSWFDAGRSASRMFVRHRYFSRAIPNDRRLVYFPLHYDPESSTMVQAPWHTNQLAIIEALAKSLPADAVLLVKEHLPMMGLRPRGYYKAIASLPRVLLLPPEVSGLWCVQKANLTAVITGTAAWEAVRLGKPALVLGDSPYLQLGEGILHEPCLSKLPEAIVKALELPPASDGTLIEFLAALHAASFEMDASLLWGDYNKHSKEAQAVATSSIVEGIVRAHGFRHTSPAPSEMREGQLNDR